METPVIWLILFILLLGIEILTMGLTTIWFAGGALAGFFAALAGAGVLPQVVLFGAVSLALLAFTRPLAVKYLNHKTTRTNVDSMVGRHGEVTEEIHNLQARGQVQVDGVFWTARAEREDQVIPAGTEVTVVRVSGVKLIVKAVQEEKPSEPSEAP